MQFAAFALLCLIWSSSWLAIRFSLQGYPPFLGCGLRFMVAALLLGLIAGFKRLSFRVPIAQIRFLALNGLLGYILTYGLIYWAEQYLNAGVTAVIFATFPLFTALFSIFAYRLEAFRGGVAVGLSLAFAGVAAIFGHDLSSARLEGAAPWGGAAVLSGSAAAAATVGMVKKHLHGVRPVILSFYGMLLGAAGLTAGGILRGEQLPENPPMAATAAVIYLGAAASALAFSIYYRLLKEFRPTTMSVIIYITPVLTLLLDWLVFGLAPSTNILAGIALILTGILIAELPRYRRDRASRLTGQLPHASSAKRPSGAARPHRKEH